MTKLAFAIALSVMACKGSGSGGTGDKAAAGDCKALDRAVDMIIGDARKELDPEIPAEKKAAFDDAMKRTAVKVKTNLIGACVADKWSDDAIACVRAADSQAEFEACDNELTPAQSTKAEAAVDDAIAEMVQSLGGG